MSKRIVLFVHGLGQQSQLSALLHPLLSLTTNLETGMTGAQRNHLPNLLSEWDVVDLDVHTSPPSIHLHRAPAAGPRANPATGATPTDVNFYEFNYSHLTEVIRDINAVSLERLLAQFHEELALALPALETARAPEALIARQALRIGDVILAASAPMLGVFPFFTQYLGLGHIIKAYRRFFADVATCALDYPGADLLFAHFDHTVQSIFEKEGNLKPGDEFIVVAHSLGTVLTHGYIVQRWSEGAAPKYPVPSKVLTFGTAVSLLCWLWLYLDYERMDPARWNARTIRRPGRFEEFMIFCWRELKLPSGFTPSPLVWINALNRLDPIATEVPNEYVFFGADPSILSKTMPTGVDHRFINRSWWRGSPHNTYFQDRPLSRLSQKSKSEQFSDILKEVIGFDAPRPAAERVKERDHWVLTVIWLSTLQVVSYIIGLAAAVLMLWAYSSPAVFTAGIDWLWLPPFLIYLIPAAIVFILSFAHKVIWGSWSPHEGSPATLSWNVLRWLRIPFSRILRRRRGETELFVGEKVLRRVLSLLAPITLLVVIPWILAAKLQHQPCSTRDLVDFALNHYFRFSGGVLAGSLGTLALCATRFLGSWRSVVCTRKFNSGFLPAFWKWLF